MVYDQNYHNCSTLVRPIVHPKAGLFKVLVGKQLIQGELLPVVYVVTQNNWFLLGTGINPGAVKSGLVIHIKTALVGHDPGDKDVLQVDHGGLQGRFVEAGGHGPRPDVARAPNVSL
jgi:hypothetical protein